LVSIQGTNEKLMPDLSASVEVIAARSNAARGAAGSTPGTR
jgi:hypothetical protein